MGNLCSNNKRKIEEKFMNENYLLSWQRFKEHAKTLNGSKHGGNELQQNIVARQLAKYFQKYGRVIVENSTIIEILKSYITTAESRKILLFEGGRETFIAIRKSLPWICNMGYLPFEIFVRYLVKIEGEIWKMRTDNIEVFTEQDISDLGVIYRLVYEFISDGLVTMPGYEERLLHLFNGTSMERRMAVETMKNIRCSDHMIYVLQQSVKYARDPLIDILDVLLKHAKWNEKFNTIEFYESILIDPCNFKDRNVGEFFLGNDEYVTNNLVQAFENKYKNQLITPDRLYLAIRKHDIPTVLRFFESNQKWSREIIFANYFEGLEIP